MRNNRIGTNGFLNQYCALAPDLESMLLARTRKILLQQYLQLTDFSRSMAKLLATRGGIEQVCRS
jgi:hypothetical protein